MIGIDWVAVVVLGAAWALSNVRSIPLAARHGALAVAFLGLAGFRLLRGAAGLNLLFVVLAGVFGVQYAVRASRARRR